MAPRTTNVAACTPAESPTTPPTAATPPSARPRRRRGGVAPAGARVVALHQVDAEVAAGLVLLDRLDPLGDRLGVDLPRQLHQHLHQVLLDRLGDTPSGKSMKVHDLRSAEVQKQTDVELTKVISEGKGKMPPYGKQLS